MWVGNPFSEAISPQVYLIMDIIVGIKGKYES